MSVSLALLSAHLLADFPLQTDHMAANKLDDWMVRLAHAAVHVMVTNAFLFLLTPYAIIYALMIGVIHFIIDSKRLAEPKDNFELYPIAVDQSLHITSLFFISLII